MDYLPGEPLSNFWENLTFEEKKPFLEEFVMLIVTLRKF